MAAAPFFQCNVASNLKINKFCELQVYCLTTFISSAFWVALTIFKLTKWSLTSSLLKIIQVYVFLYVYYLDRFIKPHSFIDVDYIKKEVQKIQFIVANLLKLLK